MKRMTAVLVLICLLCGCSGDNRGITRAMSLRQRILSASECRFGAEITADYGNLVYTFSMDCVMDSSGDVSFTVQEPESLSGIRGEIADEGGKLTFEDTALNFPILSEDMPSPVSASWILMKTLRSGYLRAAGKDDALLKLTIDDSYQDDALQLDIWINEQDVPVCGDILYNGMRIIAVSVKDFRIV